MSKTNQLSDRERREMRGLNDRVANIQRSVNTLAGYAMATVNADTAALLRDVLDRLGLPRSALDAPQQGGTHHYDPATDSIVPNNPPPATESPSVPNALPLDAGEGGTPEKHGETEA